MSPETSIQNKLLNIPKGVVKGGATLVNKAFEKVGEVGALGADKAFENLPQTQSVQQFKPVAQELASLATVLIVGKAIHSASEVPKALREVRTQTAGMNDIVTSAAKVLDIPVEKTVLGQIKKVDPEVVKSKYREIAHQAHPDRGGTAQEFQTVAAARQILDDHTNLSRQQFINKYDAPLEQIRKSAKQLPETTQPAPSAPVEAQATPTPEAPKVAPTVTPEAQVAPAQTDIYGNKLPAQTTLAEPPVVSQPLEVRPSESTKIVLNDSPLHDRVMTELINAEAGKRIGLRNEGSSGMTFSAQKSTFPQWIPSELRKKPLLDAVATHIQNGTLPTKAAETRLYSIVADEMKAQNEVLADEHFVARERANLYNTFATAEENAAAQAKFDAEYAKLKTSQPRGAQTSGAEVSPVGEPIQAQAEPAAKAQTEVKPAVQEAINIPKPEPAIVEVPKPEPSPREMRIKSQVYERLQADNPTLTEDLTYEKQNLRKNAENAVDLIATDKEQAYRIAMGVEEPPEGQTSTAINIALAERALHEANYDLFGQLTRSRSLEQTRRGQELVAEKGSITDNSTSRYVKELIKIKMDRLGGSYLGNLKSKLLEKGQEKSKAIQAIDAEVEKVRSKIRSTKELDLAEAQSFLDSLACK